MKIRPSLQCVTRQSDAVKTGLTLTPGGVSPVRQAKVSFSLVVTK